jgi:hypothetical protein
MNVYAYILGVVLGLTWLTIIVASILINRYSRKVHLEWLRSVVDAAALEDLEPQASRPTGKPLN